MYKTNLPTFLNICIKILNAENDIIALAYGNGKTGIKTVVSGVKRVAAKAVSEVKKAVRSASTWVRNKYRDYTNTAQNTYRRTKKWVHNTARTVSQKVRNTSHSVVKHTRNFVNNHRRAIEITRNVVAIASIALIAIPLVAPVAIPAMAITSLEVLGVGLDLAVGDNTSAAAGLLCLFPMGKGFKFLKEIGGEAATSGSKAIKITNNFCENENILKRIFNKLSKGEKKLIEEGACFVAGTKIITKDGYKSIENIKIGDKVLSQNVDTGEKEYKEVKNVFVKEVDTLVQLHIKESKIDTTKNHRFWIVDKGWIKAENLKEGEKILVSSGKISIISKVSKQKLKEAVKVYNFEVSDWHTYFVSNIGVLVHNNCMMKPKGAGNLKINNMNEFFEESFGNSIKGSLTKTNSKFQGQSIYEVSKKVDNQYLKKGDKIYLDNLHKDHLEVFDKKGNAKAVLNLDGTLNYDKTEKVLNEGRKLKMK